MTKYIGKEVVALYGTVDVSGKYTTIDVTEEAPEANRIDVSDKSSSVIETEEGLPGEPKFTANLAASDEVGGNTAVLGLTVNDEDTLFFYPEGQVVGKPQRTIQNVRLGSRKYTAGYQTKAEWALGFYAYETVLDDTYTT